jgi:hypothetical protein
VAVKRAACGAGSEDVSEPRIMPFASADVLTRGTGVPDRPSKLHVNSHLCIQILHEWDVLERACLKVRHLARILCE